jgi:transcriptional regulator with XRE-family HTH domain
MLNYRFLPGSVDATSPRYLVASHATSCVRCRQHEYDEIVNTCQTGSMSIFAKRLKTARELRKLSQSQLAEETQLQPSAISHFEIGNRSPSFDNLKRLADALDVTTDYLIGRSDSPQVSAETATQLFRDAGKLSSEDLKFLQRMAEDLAKRKR